MEAIKKILRTPSAFVLLLVAIVSLIGVIVKSETDKAIARMPIDATSTAEARMTELANLSNMTQSAVLPSATWTPSLIITQTSLPTLTPTTDDLEPVLLKDEFVDNRNGWLLQNKQGIKSKIIGGKYTQSISCPETYEALYCGYYMQVPKLISKDLQFEVDTLIKNVSINTEVMISFQFRRNANNYYNIYFRSIDKYTVNIVYNGSQDKLADSSDLGYNPSAVTRLGFLAKDSMFIPLIYDRELPSVEDGNINQAGAVYIAIFVSRGGSATVELDNLLAIDKSN